MQETTYNLEQLLDSASAWEIEGDHFKVSMVTKSHSVKYIDVQTHDLTARHPDLPDALRAYIRLNHENSYGSWLDNTVVRATLSLWENACVVAVNDEGTTFHLVDVTVFEQTMNGTLWLAGTEITPMEIEGEHGTYKVATNLGIAAFSTSLASLDLHYPAWQERYQLCYDLGATDEEKIGHVFFNKSLPQVAVSLPDTLSM